MNPIPAKYAGVCARTGKKYPAGALIVKLANNTWALAQDKAGNVKVGPDWRTALMPDGEEKMVDVNGGIFCKTCMSADGILPGAVPDNFDKTPYTMTVETSRVYCERCGRTITLLSHAEVAARRESVETEREQKSLADVMLVHEQQGFYTLSQRVPAEIWAKVAQYFQYWSADDLDEMDYFNMSGGYYVQSQQVTTDEPLNGAPPSDMTVAQKIEEILNVKPENRLAFRQARAREKAEIDRLATEAERAITARRRLLFDAKDGEYLTEGVPFHPKGLQIGEGPNIYGGGAWYVIEDDGEYIWHIQNNGMDGDDWSRNNVGTGGAGAIGFRFPSTPERIEALRALPGGEKIGVPAVSRREEIIGQLANDAFKKHQDLAPLFAEIPTVPSHYVQAYWVDVDGLTVGLPPDHSAVYVATTCRNEFLRAMRDENISISGGYGVYLEYAPTPERIALVADRLPSWVGTSVPGRFAVGNRSMSLCDNAADALRLVSILKTPLNQDAGEGGVSFTPDVRLVHCDKSVCAWSDGAIFRLGGLSLPSLYRCTSDDWEGFPPLPQAADLAPTMTPAASKLLKLALGRKYWLEGNRLSTLLGIQEETGRTMVQQRKGRNTWDDLVKVSVLLTSGESQDLYIVEHGWACMGEDGDSGEETALYDDLADAKKDFARKPFE